MISADTEARGIRIWVMDKLARHALGEYSEDVPGNPVDLMARIDAYLAAALRAREAQTVEAAFAHGVLAALHVVFAHDEETLYDEIVGTVGIENLLAACEPGDREMVGLVKYGWAGRHPRKLAPLTPGGERTP